MLTKQDIIAHIKESLASRKEQPGVNEAMMVASYALLAARCKAMEHYALHWIEVAFDGTNSRIKQQIGILHDVIEDTDWTATDLRAIGFDERVVAGVEAMTRDEEKESYFDFIERCSQNAYALDVKMNDLRHNLNHSRNDFLIDEKGRMRVNRYIISYQYLLAVKKDRIEAGLPIEKFVAQTPRLGRETAKRVLESEGRKLPSIRQKFSGLLPA